MYGQILYNYKTNRISVFAPFHGRTASFDIPNQDLASMYQGATVMFEINEMDDAVNIVINNL